MNEHLKVVCVEVFIDELTQVDHPVEVNGDPGFLKSLPPGAIENGLVTRQPSTGRYPTNLTRCGGYVTL